MPTPVPSLTQEFYDENRALYGAETTTMPLDFQRCAHANLRRQNANEIQCKNCLAGWTWEVIPESILKLCQ